MANLRRQNSLPCAVCVRITLVDKWQESILRAVCMNIMTEMLSSDGQLKISQSQILHEARQRGKKRTSCTQYL